MDTISGGLVAGAPGTIYKGPVHAFRCYGQPVNKTITKPGNGPVAYGSEMSCGRKGVPNFTNDDAEFVDTVSMSGARSTSTEQLALSPPSDEGKATASYTRRNKTAVERKRRREKQRRTDTKQKFEELASLLRELNTDFSAGETAEETDGSNQARTRLDVIDCAIATLRKIHGENENRKKILADITGHNDIENTLANRAHHLQNQQLHCIADRTFLASRGMGISDGLSNLHGTRSLDVSSYLAWLRLRQSSVFDAETAARLSMVPASGRDLRSDFALRGGQYQPSTPLVAALPRSPFPIGNEPLLVHPMLDRDREQTQITYPPLGHYGATSCGDAK